MNRIGFFIFYIKLCLEIFFINKTLILVILILFYVSHYYEIIFGKIKTIN